MYRFKNDYNVVAHEKILKEVLNNSNKCFNGYGDDEISQSAKKLIQSKIDKEVEIYFLVGGTQTNKTVISQILRPHEAVLATDIGHIFVHETGAIEDTGHKILTTPNTDGKINLELSQKLLDEHLNYHMVKPKLLFIANATEAGTYYNLKELQAIREFCNKNNLILYIDGARLGVALENFEEKVTLNDIANVADVFYIGGTKNGAMLGEAVVFVNKEISNDFLYTVKQKGALYSKGFIAGCQFKALFEDDLFYEIASSANEAARKLSNGLLKNNIKLRYPTKTNQVFIILSNKQIDQLQQKYACEVLETIDESTSVARLVTSFITRDEDIEDVVKLLTHNNEGN